MDKDVQEELKFKLHRIPTGIPGLDSMVDGGFPFPSAVMVAGSAGTGKTTFALQFMCEGARNGEKGLYFTTLSEPTQWMLRFSSRFEFLDPAFFGNEIEYVDLGDVIKKEKDPFAILAFMEDKIAETMPQRIVVDPISVFGERLFEDYRIFLYYLTINLKNWQATTILTGEVAPSESYPIEVSYIVDGVIILSYELINDARQKFLEVLKMRGTNHVTGRHLVAITKDGLSVQPGLR